MSKKIITRIQNKYDTEANWLRATSFIPLKGETIYYAPDANHAHTRTKVGDGVTPVNDLPFEGILSEADELIQKGLTQGSIIIGGQGSIAGAKGFYIRGMGIHSLLVVTTDEKPAEFNEDGTVSDYVNNWTSTCTDIDSDPLFAEYYDPAFTGLSGYEVGDLITIFNGYHYAHCVEICEIRGNFIGFNGDLPFEAIQIYDNNGNRKRLWDADQLLYVPAKPEVGFVLKWVEDDKEYHVFSDATVFGNNNKASAENAFVAGYDNIAIDDYATIFGRNNIGGYGNLMGGGWNNITGKHSLIGGTHHIAISPLSSYNIIGGKGNTVDSSYSLVGGAGNTDHGTYQNFMVGENNTISSGRYVAMFGANNISSKDNTFTVGQKNKNHSKLSAIFNYNNTIEDGAGELHFVAGRDNVIKIGELNFVIGRGNTNEAGSKNFIFGQGNKIKSSYSIIGGANNIDYGAYQNFIMGQFNEITSGSKTAVFGENNKVAGDHKLIGGRWVSDAADLLFAIGNGAKNAPSNAIAVHSDGRVTLGANPTNSMDAVTKQYLEDNIPAALMPGDRNIKITDNKIALSPSVDIDGILTIGDYINTEAIHYVSSITVNNTLSITDGDVQIQKRLEVQSTLSTKADASVANNLEVGKEIKASGTIRSWTGLRLGSDSNVSIGNQNAFNIGVGAYIDAAVLSTDEEGNTTQFTKNILIGNNLTATRSNQFIIGAYNDTSDTTSKIVVAKGNATTGKNTFTIDDDGNLTTAGKVTIASTLYANSSIAVGNNIEVTNNITAGKTIKGVTLYSTGNTSIDGDMKTKGILRTWSGLRIGGDNNVDIGGQDSLNIGVGTNINISAATKSIAVGDNLTVGGKGQFVLAENYYKQPETIEGRYNIVHGDTSNCQVTGNYNAVLCSGGNNIVDTQHNLLVGAGNTVTGVLHDTGEANLVVGVSNSINGANYSGYIGRGLKSTGPNQLIVGKYNDDTQKDILFAVGNGSGARTPVAIHTFLTTIDIDVTDKEDGNTWFEFDGTIISWDGSTWTGPSLSETNTWDWSYNSDAHLLTFTENGTWGDIDEYNSSSIDRKNVFSVDKYGVTGLNIVDPRGFNVVGHDRNIIVGYDNTTLRANVAEHTRDSLLVGRGLQPTGWYQTVLGQYNDAENDAVDAPLIIGWGDNENGVITKKTILIVKKDGRVTVASDPSDKMDLTTKQYVDAAIAAMKQEILNELRAATPEEMQEILATMI